MTASQTKQQIQRDWLSKTLAGVLLGLTLALSTSGILSELAKPMPLPTRGQLVMWIVPPIWLVIASAVYFFTSSQRAWLWLFAANVVTFGVFWALHRFSFMGA